MRRYLFLIALLSAFMVACSRSSEIDLSKDWEVYHVDISGMDITNSGIECQVNQDACTPPGIEDDGWQAVSSLPAALTMERKKQLCWLRKEVAIPELYRGQRLSLYLGKLWDTETTYLNGVPIGVSGREYPDFHSDWNHPAYHYLPGELINYGDTNVILVRQFSDQQLNFNGDPYIGETFSVRNHAFWVMFMSEYLVMALGIMTLLVGLSMLISYMLTGTKDRVNLHFGGISVLWFILTMHFWLPSYGDISWRIQDNLFYVLVGSLVVWIYFSLEAMLRYRIRWARITVVVLFIIQAMIAITATNTNPITGWRFDLMGPIGLMVQVLWGYVIIKGIRDRNPEARILLIGYIIFVATLFHDALMMNRVIMSYAFMSNIAYPGFILSFAIIIFRRVAIMNRQLHESSDEINQKNERLQQLMLSVVESVDELIAISITVKDSSGVLNSQMENQAASLEETSATLEEVSSSITSIADHAQQQDGMVKGSESDMKEYLESLERITEAAQYASWLGGRSQQETSSVSERLQRVANGMLKMKELSESITGIADMINEIAEKTNLLSLNAAIEAARAGEHGRGFAVVAEEIGKLADSSVSQAKTIQNIVQEVLTDIEEETAIIVESSDSIKEVNRVTENVSVSIDAILKLCEAQEKLTDNVNNRFNGISQGSSEISTATREQMLAMNEVMQSIVSLNDVVEKVNESTGKMVEISDKLAHRIALLNKIVMDQ